MPVSGLPPLHKKRCLGSCPGSVPALPDACSAPDEDTGVHLDPAKTWGMLHLAVWDRDAHFLRWLLDTHDVPLSEFLRPVYDERRHDDSTRRVRTWLDSGVGAPEKPGLRALLQPDKALTNAVAMCLRAGSPALAELALKYCLRAKPSAQTGAGDDEDERAKVLAAFLPLEPSPFPPAFSSALTTTLLPEPGVLSARLLQLLEPSVWKHETWNQALLVLQAAVVTAQENEAARRSDLARRLDTELELVHAHTRLHYALRAGLSALVMHLGCGTAGGRRALVRWVDWALQHECTWVLKQLLSAAGNQVDDRAGFAELHNTHWLGGDLNVLHLAVLYASTEAVELVAGAMDDDQVVALAGPAPRDPDHAGQTALHLAVAASNVSALQALVRGRPGALLATNAAGQNLLARAVEQNAGSPAERAVVEYLVQQQPGLLLLRSPPEHGGLPALDQALREFPFVSPVCSWLLELARQHGARFSPATLYSFVQVKLGGFEPDTSPLATRRNAEQVLKALDELLGQHEHVAEFLLYQDPEARRSVLSYALAELAATRSDHYQHVGFFAARLLRAVAEHLPLTARVLQERDADCQRSVLHQALCTPDAHALVPVILRLNEQALERVPGFRDLRSEADGEGNTPLMRVLLGLSGQDGRCGGGVPTWLPQLVPLRRVDKTERADGQEALCLAARAWARLQRAQGLGRRDWLAGQQVLATVLRRLCVLGAGVRLGGSADKVVSGRVQPVCQEPGLPGVTLGEHNTGAGRSARGTRGEASVPCWQRARSTRGTGRAAARPGVGGAEDSKASARRGTRRYLQRKGERGEEWAVPPEQHPPSKQTSK